MQRDNRAKWKQVRQPTHYQTSEQVRADTLVYGFSPWRPSWNEKKL